MIEQFLQEMFGGSPATFADRFDAGNPAGPFGQTPGQGTPIEELLRQIAPPPDQQRPRIEDMIDRPPGMQQPMGGDLLDPTPMERQRQPGFEELRQHFSPMMPAPMPGDATEFSAARRLGGDVPMPRARPVDAPDMMARLSGNAPPPTPQGPSIFDRLAGNVQGDRAPGLLGLLGMNQTAAKRLQSTLAGGFAQGDPRFKGGAFMKGMSGGLSGGLKSDREDSAAAIASDDKSWKREGDTIDRDVKQRTLAEREKSGEALRKLYGVRAQTAAAGPRAGVTERLVDALRKENPNLSYAKALEIAKRAPPNSNAATLAASLAKHDDIAFTRDPEGTMRKWHKIVQGIQAESNSPAIQPSEKVWGDKEAEEAGLYETAPKAAPMPGARQAPDGNWYLPDPSRPGKYLQVE